MKLTLTILITLAFYLETIAQEVVKNGVVGFSGNVTIIDYSFRGYIEPYMAWGTQSKQILVAPTILIASNLGYQSPQTPRLTGARVGYRFWPGTLDKKWEFYLSADLRLQRLGDRWNANLYNENLSDYQEYQVKTVELLIENYLGYGLTYKINKQLSVSQGVGLGWYGSNLQVKTSDQGRNLSDVVDYRGYDNIGFIWNVSLGINYKLPYNK